LESTVLEQRIDSAVAEYLEAVERGEATDPKRWLERYPDVAGELEAFFAAETRFDRLLAPLRSPATPSIRDGTATASPPLRTVKDYELLSEIGRGGMGIIFKARQQSLNRLAAVKMIRTGEWASSEDRLRFRFEAETIAALDHPNIVPIYEVGEVASEDGTQLPFFSMKLIEGENLSQARGRFRKEYKSITQLMILVTRAVEHAHQRGVLHRDLKPANILLKISAEAVPNEEMRRGSGFALGPLFITPHISDFGLARRAQQRGQTLPGAIIGTPSYLAPEVARGHEFATSASDVYSLGAILYELLTGAPPFQGETALETIRLAAGAAVKPPCKVDPRIPQDLETICLKCLETDPGKRYASADKLAEDLEDFLAGRPIAARPSGRFGRFRRWCRRQPVIAGLSAALLLVVLVSLPLIIWNWQRAVEHEKQAKFQLGETQKERDRADEGFGLAHVAVEDIFKLLSENRWDEIPGSESFKKQLLENGLKYYRAFVERRRGDPKLQREVALATFRIGLISARMGSPREAAENLRTAVALLRSLAEEYPKEASIDELLAKSLLALGSTLESLKLLDEAIAADDEAIEVWSRLHKAGGLKALEFKKEEAGAWMNRGIALKAKDDWNGASESFHKTAAILNELAPSGELPVAYRSLKVLCLLNLFQTNYRFGRFEEAYRVAAEAKQQADMLARTNPNSEEFRFLVARAARSLGVNQVKRQEMDQARRSFKESIAALVELHREKPRIVEYSWNLAFVCGDLGSLEKDERRYPEAVKALTEAEGLLLELIGQDGETLRNREILQQIQRWLGDVYQTQGDAGAACQSFERACSQLEYLLQRNATSVAIRWDLARTRHMIGVNLAKQRKFDEAITATDEAWKHMRLLRNQMPNDQSIRRQLSATLGNKAIFNRSLLRLTEALDATMERAELWPNEAAPLYDAAACFARTYDAAASTKASAQICDRARQCVIQTLGDSVRAGLKDPAIIGKDPAFNAIRKTDEFQAFMKTISK